MFGEAVDGGFRLEFGCFVRVAVPLGVRIHIFKAEIGGEIDDAHMPRAGQR